jgi:hypothetical protein|tara:strand:+ start:186 stop:470 length:285 start_codon:yes stop_codon:yes gene_type:complete
MKFNSVNRRTIRTILIVIVLLLALSFFYPPKTSMFQPTPVTVTPVSEESIHNLPSTEECLGNSVYSTSTGGVCGGGKLVSDHANYKIVDGIGLA